MLRNIDYLLEAMKNYETRHREPATDVREALKEERAIRNAESNGWKFVGFSDAGELRLQPKNNSEMN